MWKARLACLAYCIVLTLMLLAPDAAALLGLPLLLGMGDGAGVHFAAFAVLGILVSASRLPLRRVLLAGLLFLYAVGVELLQYTIPTRSVEVRDLLQNLLGLVAGVALWEFAARCKILAWRDEMPKKERFRVLTPEGLLTCDTFVLADEQPQTVKAGCVLLVHGESGKLMTSHLTRLIPAEDPGVLAVDHQRGSPCLKCGRVEGIVADEVVCPYHGESACGLLEAKT